MSEFAAKGYRGPRPALFIRRWIKRHAPPEMRGVSIRDIAKHYRVTETAIRKWARESVPPCVGGYPRGRNGAAKKSEAKRQARARRAEPLAPPPPVDKRAAFIAELHARLPARTRLVRIFCAEWPA